MNFETDESIKKVSKKMKVGIKRIKSSKKKVIERSQESIKHLKNAEVEKE
jgi:LytS/YehU family sensor histidine kinase